MSAFHSRDIAALIRPIALESSACACVPRSEATATAPMDTTPTTPMRARRLATGILTDWMSAPRGPELSRRLSPR
jgi:hypothetical protein